MPLFLSIWAVFVWSVFHLVFVSVKDILNVIIFKLIIKSVDHKWWLTFPFLTLKYVLRNRNALTFSSIAIMIQGQDKMARCLKILITIQSHDLRNKPICHISEPIILEENYVMWYDVTLAMYLSYINCFSLIGMRSSRPQLKHIQGHCLESVWLLLHSRYSGTLEILVPSDSVQKGQDIAWLNRASPVDTLEYKLWKFHH